MNEHFNLYRSTQDSIVQSLQKQLNERSNNIGQNTPPFDANSKKSTAVVSETNERTILALEDRIRRLEYSYKAKSQELDAVLNTLEKGAPPLVGPSATTTLPADEKYSNRFDFTISDPAQNQNQDNNVYEGTDDSSDIDKFIFNNNNNPKDLLVLLKLLSFF